MLKLAGGSLWPVGAWDWVGSVRRRLKIDEPRPYSLTIYALINAFLVSLAQGPLAGQERGLQLINSP